MILHLDLLLQQCRLKEQIIKICSFEIQKREIKMITKENVQLAMLLDHSNPSAIFEECRNIFNLNYKAESFEIVENSFQLTEALYNGSFPGYRPCNTEYHNFSHILDCFIATMRLIDGRNISAQSIEEEIAADLLIAAMLHDTGYIQEEWDTTGTGAKYTKTHIKRSMEFAEKNAEAFKLSRERVDRIISLIECTGLKSDCRVSEDEMALAGSILGTADLLGQMADRAYLEKLLFLYREFIEAGLEGFETEFDILKKTLAFYDSTMVRLNKNLMRCYEFAEYHFRSRFRVKENLYIVAIEKQMNYLKKIMDDNTSNFRSKLKRIDLEKIESPYLTS